LTDNKGRLKLSSMRANNCGYLAATEMRRDIL